METGVGRWTEAAVIEQLKNLKLRLNQGEPTPNPSPQDDNPGTGVSEPPAIDTGKHSKAKARIQSISSIDEAKQLLDALCDLGYDTILDTILK
jgi:hypothetical protein